MDLVDHTSGVLNAGVASTSTMMPLLAGTGLHYRGIHGKALTTDQAFFHAALDDLLEDKAELSRRDWMRKTARPAARRCCPSSMKHSGNQYNVIISLTQNQQEFFNRIDPKQPLGRPRCAR
jgi:hypothetical protein